MFDQQPNWDDIRVFLAIMRSDSLREAAEKLGVSHPTARRRLGGLEEELGLKLFDRRQEGMVATPEAAALLPRAEAVETAMHALGRTARASEPDLQGAIRVTLPQEIACELLIADLAAFSARWPQVHLDIDTSYSVADLARREADIAIRYVPVDGTPDPDLAGRKAATSYSAIYGGGDNWIGWYGPEADWEWIRQTEFPEHPPRHASPNPYMQRAACMGGLGLTTLPCFMADPYLERRTQPIPNRDLWVLVHPDLRRNPRLRLFRDAMVNALRAKTDLLRGVQGP